MSISITVVGETIGEIYKNLGIADTKVTTASTEELVEELRRRMRPQGMVVNIDPAQEPDDDDETGMEVAAPEREPHLEPNPEPKPEPDKPRRGRPVKVVAVDKGAASEANGKAPPEKPPVTTVAGALSRDDVITALNAYAATHGGRVAGVSIMQEVCGVTRLQDIKAEDYGKLLAALKG
jgi:hypothetical protein